MPDMEDVGQAIECGCIRLCPVCDAFEVVDRKVGMLLAPRGRVPHALFMRGFTADVTVFARDDHHCPTVAEREQLARAGVRVLDDRVARLERTPQGKARAVTTNGTEHEFDTVYPMLGIRARSELATALGAQCSEEGELVVDDHQRTSVPGLFAAGDVVTTLNQISVAVGQSAIAATAIHAELR
jgi:thioredoxin reductase (NADPH)